MAADCRPRRSPPSASAASRAASSRSARSPPAIFAGVRHGRPHAVPVHQVRLNAVLGTGPVAGRRNGALARVDGHVPLGIDHGHLPHGSVGIPGEQGGERLLGGLAHGHQFEAERTVGRVDEGLGGHGADAGAGPRNDGTHGKPVGLDGNPELSAEGVAGDNGISGHGPPPVGRVGRDELCRGENQDELAHGSSQVSVDLPARAIQRRNAAGGRTGHGHFGECGVEAVGVLGADADYPFLCSWQTVSCPTVRQ